MQQFKILCPFRNTIPSTSLVIEVKIAKLDFLKVDSLFKLNESDRKDNIKYDNIQVYFKKNYSLSTASAMMSIFSTKQASTGTSLFSMSLPNFA